MWVPVVAARDIRETAAMETEVATPTMALMVPGSASPLLGCYGATTPPPILGALISVKRHSRPSGVGRWCYILVGICLCESNMHVCVFSFPLPVTNTSRKMVAVAGSKRRHPLDAWSCPIWSTPRKTTAAHKKKEEAA